MLILLNIFCFNVKNVKKIYIYVLEIYMEY